MEKKIKQRRAGTQVRCPKCDKDVIWCGYYNRRTIFRCGACDNSWEHGPEQYSIRPLRVTSESQVLTVFHGFWFKEELDKVENAFRKLILDSDGQYKDEWAFFKGRQVYTAWRLSSVSGVLQMAPTLIGLIEKVVVKCRQSQNL
jgi:hypothetical protein